MKRQLALACIGLATLGAAGCGGDSSSGDENASGEGGVTTIKVGVLPIVDVAPLFIAIEEGYFEEEGLQVEAKVGIGGAAVVPAVVGGDVEIGFSGYTSLLAAQEQGLSLATVSDGVASPEDPAADVTAVMVRADSEIKAPKDLEGKRLGVNALKGVVELSTRVAAEKAGVDVSKLQFVEVPMPEQIGALEAGEIDGALLPEPAITAALGSGARQVMPAFSAVSPGLGYAGYFSSDEFASKNPDTVAGFRAAMTKALDYARENPEAVREILPTFTEIEPAVAREIRLPEWPDNSDESLSEAIAIWGEAMVDFEFVKADAALDVDALMPQG